MKTAQRPLPSAAALKCSLLGNKAFSSTLRKARLQPGFCSKEELNGTGWPGIGLREPSGGVRVVISNRWEGLGEEVHTNTWIAKTEQNNSPSVIFSLWSWRGKYYYQPSGQKGKRGPGGLGSGWGGVAGSQNPPSSCSAIYIRPALSWTGQTPAGPQRSKPGHMFPWGKHTQTSKHQAQGGLTHSWDIAKTYSGGTLHCSLLPLTRQPTHGNKATWAPPHGPLGPSPRTPGLSRTQPRAHGLRNALPSTAI